MPWDHLSITLRGETENYVKKKSHKSKPELNGTPEYPKDALFPQIT